MRPVPAHNVARRTRRLRNKRAKRRNHEMVEARRGKACRALFSKIFDAVFARTARGGLSGRENPDGKTVKMMQMSPVKRNGLIVPIYEEESRALLQSAAVMMLTKYLANMQDAYSSFNPDSGRILFSSN